MAVLRGIEQLEAKLDKLERVARRRLLVTALKKAVERTQKRASTLAQVDTGKLRSEMIISVARSLTTSNTVVIRVGPSMDAFYGLFVEIGTAHHVAEPFLQPAYDETHDDVLADMTREFIAVLKEVA